MVEPNLSVHAEDSAKARNTREVVAIRLGRGEREQIAAAAGLAGMPVSTYLRCAALQASAAAIARVQVRSRPAPERKLRVVELEPGPERKVHDVDGELVRR
jgi:uncharacterized protein (DUF1778 family)